MNCLASSRRSMVPNGLQPERPSQTSWALCPSCKHPPARERISASGSMSALQLDNSSTCQRMLTSMVTTISSNYLFVFSWVGNPLDINRHLIPGNQFPRLHLRKAGVRLRPPRLEMGRVKNLNGGHDLTESTLTGCSWYSMTECVGPCTYSKTGR